MSDTDKDQSQATDTNAAEQTRQDEEQSAARSQNETSSDSTSDNKQDASEHKESDDKQKSASDQDPNTGNESDGDGVIKVARMPASPALFSQLEHRRDYGRARGLGAGHTGATTWRVQRWTALALIPLAIWFVVSVVRLSLVDRAAAADWLAFPPNAAVMAAFVVIALRHAVIGIESVLSDYVDGDGLRAIALLLVKLLALMLAVASIAALIHLAI